MSSFYKATSRYLKNAISFLFVAAMLVASPALANEEAQVNDPIEPFNPAMFEFNMTLVHYALAPLSRSYGNIVPHPARAGIHNALANMMAPIDLLNNLLQGDLYGSGITLKRFVVNSVAGVGGLIDVAAETGDERKQEDFGQTLGVWGVNAGPYIVWPFFGPSNPRDTLGTIVDTVSDPFFWMGMKGDWQLADAASWTRTGLSVIDMRLPLLDPLEELERTSVDFYAAIRDFSRQRRMMRVMNRSTTDRPNHGEGYRFDFPSDS